MNGKKVFTLFLKYGILITGSLVAMMPLVVVLIASFKTSTEFGTTGVLELPQSFTNIQNYMTAIADGKMILGFVNTCIILFFSLVGTILTGTMAAYVLNRFEFKYKSLIKTLFLLASLIPSVTMQVSIFQIINKLGMFNTRLSAIVLFLGTDIIAIYIFLQFLENIPKSLDESAIVDGASYWKVYGKIIFPLLKPAVVTVIIIKGVQIYNDFYIPFLYMPSSELNVISTALFKFKGPRGSQWELICAAIIVAIIPTLIVFLGLQKYIYSGLTQGAVKE